MARAPNKTLAKPIIPNPAPRTNYNLYWMDTKTFIMWMISENITDFHRIEWWAKSTNNLRGGTFGVIQERNAPYDINYIWEGHLNCSAKWSSYIMYNKGANNTLHRPLNWSNIGHTRSIGSWLLHTAIYVLTFIISILEYSNYLPFLVPQ